MKKFVAMYRVPVEVMEKWKKNTPPEVMKAQDAKLGAAMMAWMQKYSKELVDKGLPLGKNTRITAEGAEPTTNDLNYYCVVEVESLDQAVNIFKDGPHMEIPGAFIDLMEVPHMGM